MKTQQLQTRHEPQRHSSDSRKQLYSKHAGVADGVSDYERKGFIPPRTTFYAREVKTHARELRWDRLWAVQMGVLPREWRRAFGRHGEPIDEVERGFRIDPSWRYTHQVIEHLLDEFPKSFRDRVRSRIFGLANSDMQRFNAHYRGIEGAAISAALTLLYDRDELDDPESETPWYDDVLLNLCERLGNDPDGQIRLAAQIWEDW